MTSLIECVPNVSASDAKIVDRIAKAAETAGAKILDIYRGQSTNRSVITMVAAPDQIENAAFALISKAKELIDMRLHQGHHPRLGATDVCPFIPLKDANMQQCVDISRHLAERVAEELHVPVYLYANSALHTERRKLSHVRKGQYESLKSRNAQQSLLPDFGSLADCEACGATIIGARDFLIAYNINLKTSDLSIAKEIAKNIRESSLESNQSIKDCHAIGWYLEEKGIAQVSTNLTNFRETSIWKVFTRIKALASALGTEVTGSELVGLVPQAALLEVSKECGKFNDRDIDTSLGEAVRMLGLEQFTKFDLNKRVLEKLCNL